MIKRMGNENSDIMHEPISELRGLHAILKADESREDFSPRGDVIRFIKISYRRAGRLAWQLRVLAALPEDLNLVPSTHMR